MAARLRLDLTGDATLADLAKFVTRARALGVPSGTTVTVTLDEVSVTIRATRTRIPTVPPRERPTPMRPARRPRKGPR